MRTGPVPESLFELAALASGLAPRAVFDTLLASALARTVMVASRLGIFDALATGPADAATIAERCGTHPASTDKLLTALSGAGYLRRRLEGGAARYELRQQARRWLLADSPTSLHDLMELMFVVWRWLEHYEDYVKTGETLEVHRGLSPEEWGHYQRGMLALARLVAPEVALRTPVPRRARQMLDIGGAHGLFSAALCRRHRGLQATVLDLPEAESHARALIDRHNLPIAFRAGDARDAELGEQAFDVVLIANLVHHFSPEENLDLFRRIARALRPGGVLVVQEVMRPARGVDNHVAALGDLYFAALSASGTYDYDEIATWQRAAGLSPRRARPFVSYPNVGQQAATKSR